MSLEIGAEVERMNGMKMRLGWAMSLACALVFFGPGCSVKRIAVNTVGDALAGSGSVFSSDDDPELVRDAAPFSLKLMETLLAENPEHEELLLATASGFTQYAYAFVQQDAERMEDEDFERAEELRARSRRLYLRARRYAMRGRNAFGKFAVLRPSRPCGRASARLGRRCSSMTRTTRIRTRCRPPAGS